MRRMLSSRFALALNELKTSEMRCIPDNTTRGKLRHQGKEWHSLCNDSQRVTQTLFE